MDPGAQAAFEGLSSRMEQLERELALYRLIATYGPCVDSGSASAAAGLWVEDGVYDYGDAELHGSAEIEAMVNGDRHQTLITNGAAHMLGLPLIEIAQDRGTVTCYSQVLLSEGDDFRVWRVSANRWEMIWTSLAWTTERRTAYLLHGDERARALFGHAAAVAGTQSGKAL